MYLSELYGRIGQILRERGDMKVQRQRFLKTDGVVGTTLDDFINFSSEDFGVLDDYKQKQIDKNAVEIEKVGQRFIINIPFA